MIRVNDVSKSVASTSLLSRVSIEVPKGELTGLVGPSGAGKTILTRCIMALESFDEGEIRVNGITIPPDTSLYSNCALEVRRHVGMVFQVSTLPGWRTILEHIAEGPRVVLRTPRPAALAMARDWSKRLGLQDHENKYPGECSGGQLQRACFARAAVMNPEFLICDEVTSGLDPALAGEVGQIILNLVAKGMGILMISHRLEFVRRHAQQVYVIDGGRIVEKGPAQAVFESAKSPEAKRFFDAVAEGA